MTTTTAPRAAELLTEAISKRLPWTWGARAMTAEGQPLHTGTNGGARMTDMPQDDLPLLHSKRFRKVSNRYPRRVAEAYGGDIAAAAAATDDEVAERVRQWELEQGPEPRDWTAMGREEGREEAPE